MNPAISIPKEALAAFCRERGIRRLAVFGSALHDLRHILDAARQARDFVRDHSRSDEEA